MKHKKHLATMAAPALVVLALSVCQSALAADKGGAQPEQPILLAQNAPATMKGKARPNVDKHGVILKGYDPVAYFKVGKAVKGNPAHRSSFGGATYFFSSAANKAEFDKNPTRFQPQFGGWCAHSMAQGKLADSDPNAFAIYQNKLFVCTTPAAAADFKAHAATLLPQADDHWRQWVSG